MESITGNNLIFHSLETMYSYVRDMVRANGLVPVDYQRFVHKHKNAMPSLVSCIPLTRRVEEEGQPETETHMVFIQWLSPPTGEYHGVLDNTSPPSDPRWIPLHRPLPSYTKGEAELIEASSFFAANILFKDGVHFSKFRGKYFTIEDGKKNFFPVSEVSKRVWKDQKTFAEASSVALSNQTEQIAKHLKQFHRVNKKDTPEVAAVDGE